MPRIPTAHAHLALALAAGGLLTLGSSGAQASPYAGMNRGLDATVMVTAADGANYKIEITATETVAAAAGADQALYLNVQRCTVKGCVTIEHSRRPLSPSDITISPDMTAATLSTTVSGQMIHITANVSYVDPSSRTVTNPGFSVYPLESLSGGPNPRADTFVDEVGTARLGRLNCGSKTITVFTYAGVDRTGDDVRDPRSGAVTLPAGLLRGPAHPSCT